MKYRVMHPNATDFLGLIQLFHMLFSENFCRDSVEEIPGEVACVVDCAISGISTADLRKKGFVIELIKT